MRDTPSYTKIISVLIEEGGSLDKFNNKKQIDNNGDDDEKVVDENKNEKDYILKLQILKENIKTGDNNNVAESKDGVEKTAFEIASAVANAGNARLNDFKSSSQDNDNSKTKGSMSSLGKLIIQKNYYVSIIFNFQK